MYNPFTILEAIDIQEDELGDFEGVNLYYDESSIDNILLIVGFPEEYKGDITSIITLDGDGDYLAIWLSEDNSPWNNETIYHPLPFYASEDKETGKLPEYWNKDNKWYEK